MIDSAAMLEMVVRQLMVQMALFAFIALLPIIAILTGGWILRATENAVTGLALRLEDTRKKKRDEYDAYYDARLAEPAQPEPDTNIAYYEDDAISHLANK